MNPRLARGVRMRQDPRDGTPVLLSPERGLRLNPTAAATVALCNGERSVAAVGHALAQQYGAADRARIDGDVRRLLRDLQAKGLVQGVLPSSAAFEATSAHLSADNDEAFGAPSANHAAPALETPYTLVAEVTHRCALACPYCSNPLALVHGADELTTEEWLRIVDDAAALGVMQMHLTGGEPLARPDLEAIAARGRERDLYVNLVTSGVPLERPRLERLAPSLDHVQLSVQDADPAASDHVAGNVAFDKKMRVASWVKDLGLPLTINVVLHRENADRVSEIIAMAEGLGADRLELANVQLVSWALENRAALLPSRRQIEAARSLARAAQQRLEGRMQIVLVLPDWHAGRPRACMDGWARRFVVVAPDGAVLPCHAARSLPLYFEGVRSRPLGVVWRAGAALNAFRGLGWMPEPCRSCPGRELDFGGCRCQAFAMTGDASATDPACSLSPNHGVVLMARDDADRMPGQRFLYRGRNGGPPPGPGS